MPVWLFSIIGVLWVGGWGLAFFRNPEYICRLFGQVETAKLIRRIRIIGVIELGTVVIGLAWIVILAIVNPDLLADFLFSK